jgi:hypothetical protein
MGTPSAKRSHNPFPDHAGRRFAAKRVHILHKSAQLCKLLRDPGRSDERAFAAANLNETPAHTILNCPANGNAASLKSFNESVFERLEILRGRPRPLQGGHQTAFC